jgi:hypothetical protein
VKPKLEGRIAALESKKTLCSVQRIIIKSAGSSEGLIERFGQNDYVILRKPGESLEALEVRMAEMISKASITIIRTIV